MTPDEQFVMVPVPQHMVTDVYAFITSRSPGSEPAGSPPRGGGGKESAAASDDDRADNQRQEWTEALLDRNWQESPPAMRAVLSFLADRSPQKTPITELAFAVYEDGNRNKLAGVLGAFGRRCKNRYKTETWPFSAEWNWQTSLYEYSMPAWVAAIIIELRS